MINFESYAENMDKDNFYAKSEKIISQDAISLDDFKDHYGEDVIKEDERYVDQMERKFKQEDTPEKREVLKLATIFEALIHKHIKESDWLGSNASSIKTSRYDDIKNGIDNIVEFKETKTSASYLGLA